MESIDSRKIELLDWLLSACGLRSVSILPMLGDASFRRYFRVMTPEASYVVMDAPPPHENCAPFVAIAHALRNKGLCVPEIFFADLERGYLLMSDLGEFTYLHSLNNENADLLYGRALEALAVMQSINEVPERPLPPFTREFMRKEWAWCKEWYLGKLLNIVTIPNLG